MFVTRVCADKVGSNIYDACVSYNKSKLIVRSFRYKRSQIYAVGFCNCLATTRDQYKVSKNTVKPMLV